jgi:hypothetical protein
VSRQLLILVLLCGCAGCATHEHPLVAPAGPAFDAALIGDWITVANEGSVQLHFEPEGTAGRLDATFDETGKDREVEHFHVITARIEQLDYASLSPFREKETDDSPLWMLARYTLTPSGVLAIEIEDAEFFDAAVKNGDLPGVVKKERELFNARTVREAATEQELREFVRVNSSLIFNGTRVIEFRRVGH